jgi:hypothetical protein
MKQRHYIDFKLYLTRLPDDQSTCHVTLLPTTEVGESRQPVIVSMNNAPSQELLSALANKSITQRQLVELGKELADCLLPDDEIRALFTEALHRIDVAGGLRLRLILADNALRQWPWEYTYLNLLGGPESMRNFLVLDPRISFVRHEPLPRPHAIIPPADHDITELNMAVASALPEGARYLQVEQEIENIKRAVNDFNLEGVHITCDPVLINVTPKELEHALSSTESVYLFHFAGHGITTVSRDMFNRGTIEEGFLLLVKDKTSKTESRLSANDLAVMLQRAGIRLAVLGACHSGVRNERYPWDSIAGALVAHDIPAIIAMQYEVNDDQAVAVSDTFYSALGSGLSLDEAMSLGRLAMLRSADPDPDKPFNVEWGVPVLYSRLTSGALFPERMTRAGAAAEQLRKIINQTVERIEKDGKVVGIEVTRVKGGFKVEQRVDVVYGTLIGAKVGTVEDSASVFIKQELGTVEGKAIGGTFEEL